MSLFADIATGNTGTADVFFLIAAIVFGIAAVLHVVPVNDNPARPYSAWSGFLVAVGLTFVAVAFLLL